MSEKTTKKLPFWKKEISFGRVSVVDMAVFAKHLSVMIEAGLTVHESLEIAADSAKGKLKKVIGKLVGFIEEGTSLADAMAKYPKVFPGLFTDVVRAGEASGTLAGNLTNIAEQLKREEQLVRRVKSAMTYPAIVLIAAFFLALGMAYYILPQITPLFKGLKGIELPLSTRMVLWFSDLMRAHGLAVVTGSLAILVGVVALARANFSQPVTHKILLKFPLLKHISKSSNLARFCLTFGTLLGSGVNIDNAVQITSGTVTNRYYRLALAKVASEIQSGKSMAENLQQFEHLFPKLVINMVNVGEQSGNLSETLLYLADFYEQEVDTSTTALTTALEPILLLLIGVVVTTLGLAIITPIYEITGSVSANR